MTRMTDPTPTQVERCPVCSWPIVPDGEAGCWKTNCSYRPERGTSEWYRIKARRAALRTDVVEMMRVYMTLQGYHL